MGRFRVKGGGKKSPLEETFERVWRVEAKNDPYMVPDELRVTNPPGNPLISVLRDGRKKIQLALARATLGEVQREPTMDLFSGEAAIPFTLLRMNAIPRLTLVDQEEAYERKCKAVTKDFQCSDRVDFLRQHILPTDVQLALQIPEIHSDIPGFTELSRMALPLPDIRQVTIISTGIGLPIKLRGDGTGSFNEVLEAIMEEGPEMALQRFAIGSRNLHIKSIELGDVLSHLSGHPRHVIMVDRPFINISNLKAETEEHIEAELRETQGWRHTRTTQLDREGTIVTILEHE